MNLFFQLAAMFDDEFSWVEKTVIARRNIKDNPLAKDDAAAKKGDVGTVEDWDGEFFYVDFGKGAIVCDKKDIRLK